MAIFTPKRVRFSIGSGVVFIPLLLLVSYCLSAVVWLPDLISSGAEHVIGQAANDRGESFELIQRWVGDGYLTGVRHRMLDGKSVFAIGDGDAARAFRCKISMNHDGSFVVFEFSGKKWLYYWPSRSLNTGNGQSKEAT